jgi:hypothetical protein
MVEQIVEGVWYVVAVVGLMIAAFLVAVMPEVYTVRFWKELVRDIKVE